jgi:predicted nucleic acid-binding protein
VSASPRVFLDSNVLISALIGDAGSPPAALVDWMCGGRLGLMLTGECNLREIERNLSAKLPAAAPLWKRFLVRSGIEVVACPTTPVRGVNAKDAPMVGAALKAKCRYFVTGDKRLLAEITKSQGTALIPLAPREMLEALLKLNLPR